MKYTIALGVFLCVTTFVFAGGVIPPAEGCPSGWLGDGACNILPGEQKCRTGYDCVSGYCCQEPNATESVTQCPQGQIKVVGSCRQNSNPSDPALECPTGSTCYNGICCRSAVTPQCPSGEVQIPGECEDLSRSPVGRAPFPTCPTPATCYNGICCRSATETPTTSQKRKCPNGLTQVPGSCHSRGKGKSVKSSQPVCPADSKCFGGICCRADNMQTCQTGYTQVTGQCPNCPQGSQCQNGICCQPIVNSSARCPTIRQLMGEEQRRLCPVNKISPDECRTNADCLNVNQGSLCCSDKCGRKYCYSPFTTTTASTTIAPTTSVLP